MHPFPSPMMLGKQASLVGVVNTPTVGALPWSVPYPTGTRAGDHIVIVVADATDLLGNVAFLASGATSSISYSAQNPETNLVSFSKVLDSTDISSGVSITGTPSTLCGAVFIFRGPLFYNSRVGTVQQSALSNGATATVTGYSPNAQHVANLSILMTKSAAFTASPLVPWQNATVNGSNASFLWQILDGGYGGQSVAWSNVQNMSNWLAFTAELRR